MKWRKANKITRALRKAKCDFLPSWEGLPALSSSFHLSIPANKFLCSLLTDDLPGGKRIRATGTSTEAHEAGV